MFLLEVFDTSPRGETVDIEYIGLFTTQGKAIQYLIDELGIDVNTKGYRYSLTELKVIM